MRHTWTTVPSLVAAAKRLQKGEGFHVARPIALYPAILGKGEAVKLFAEILHHIVPLELTMGEHIQVNALLQIYCRTNLRLDELIVLQLGPFASFSSRASSADFLGLRKRADDGGME